MELPLASASVDGRWCSQLESGVQRSTAIENLRRTGEAISSITNKISKSGCTASRSARIPQASMASTERHEKLASVATAEHSFFTQLGGIWTRSHTLPFCTSRRRQWQHPPRYNANYKRVYHQLTAGCSSPTFQRGDDVLLIE